LTHSPPLVAHWACTIHRALGDGVEPIKSETHRLLLVDDNSRVRRAIGRLLDTAYEIADVASAREAIAVVESRRFDLVLLDINLGRGQPTGLDCLRWLPETGHRGAVCMLTAHLSPELLHEALLLGADDYLVKCGDYQLKAEVERLVELGHLPPEGRPRYETIADPGLLCSLRLNADQIDILTKMLEQGFPPDKQLAEELGLGAKALAERIARIEARFGTGSRRQLIRYLTVLAGYVRRSRLEHEREDRSALLSGATTFDLPRGWGAQRED